jgi:hypothetical protein
MRNTILTFVAAGSLTLGALTPALAVGLDCVPDYPNLDRCPLYGGNATPRASAYQLSSRPVRHAQYYHGGYHYRY